MADEIREQNSANQIREQSLKRNADFLIQLDIENPITRTGSRTKTRTRKEGVANLLPPRSKSARVQNLQNLQEKVIEYKCKKCNNGKPYKSMQGLRIHQSQNCSGSKGYKPKSYFCLTNQEIEQMFHVNSNPNTNIASIEENGMSTLEQNIFDNQDESQSDVQSNENDEISENNETTFVNGNSFLVATQHEGNAPITTFASGQQNICSYIFGDEFLSSQTFEDVVNAVQNHYKKSGAKNSSLAQSISANHLYSFSLECGLSRSNCTKLLSVIRSFNPSVSVPKTFQGIEKKCKKLFQHTMIVLRLRFHGLEVGG